MHARPVQCENNIALTWNPKLNPEVHVHVEQPQIALKDKGHKSSFLSVEASESLKVYRPWNFFKGKYFPLCMRVVVHELPLH